MGKIIGGITMRWNEEQLRRAALIAREKDIARLEQQMGDGQQPSAAFEARMQQLIAKIGRKEIEAASASMGWRYYMRNGLAAALLGLLLLCATAPEAVMAGCQRIIEAVETIFAEYTEYRYTSNAAADTPFVPLTFGYLPDNLEEVEHEEREDALEVLYVKEEVYFILEQKLLTEENGMTYIVDTEDANVETIWIGTEEVTLVYKNKIFDYIWLHDAYEIDGQTNLSKESLIKILQQIEF
jgi:hypothetical protein